MISTQHTAHSAQISGNGHGTNGHATNGHEPPHYGLLREKIAVLKQERNAVILAHNYQEGAIQDVADCVGDSLNLAKYARTTDADTIVFCGESTSWLRPRPC